MLKRSIFLFAMSLCLPQQASAQFAVCNQTLDVMNVAIGYFDQPAFKTEGWWTIGPNQCANVIPDRLYARYMYVFAQDAFGQAIVVGDKTMCVGPDRFRITGELDCLLRGYLDAPFKEVDIHRTERWTLYIAPPEAEN